MISHLQATQGLASGIHAVPYVSTSFAATVAAHRFFKNDRVSLRNLARPLLEAGREEAARSCNRYLLVVHDWSQLMYQGHRAKKDRVVLSSNRVPEGYDLQTALLVSDRDGIPLAPAVLSLRAADGVHCSRYGRVRPAASRLDELDPTMAFIEQQNLGFPLVHIIDADADSVGHYRQWSEWPGRMFLVRADDRFVEHQGQQRKCSAIREELRQQDRFVKVREVKYHGRRAWQWIVEVGVRLTRPAQRNRPGTGDYQRIYGPPLALRLVIAEVRDEQGVVLAVWYLLSNVPADLDAATLVLWYYWRWSIETYFKLLKSAGMNSRAMATNHSGRDCPPVAGGKHGLRNGLATGSPSWRGASRGSPLADGFALSANRVQSGAGGGLKSPTCPCRWREQTLSVFID